MVIFKFALDMPPRKAQSDEAPKTKKRRTMDLLKRPPTLANMNFVGPLPQHVFFDTIASWTHGFLDLKDLLTLSMVSRSFYYTMNHTYWEGIVQAPKFQSMYKVAAFAKLNPRQRAIRIMTKRMCIHCRQIQQNDIKPLRPRQEAYMVCQRCADLPLFAEIQYTAAINKYELTRDQLMTLPSRKQAVYCGYRRLFKLKDVLDLVEELHHDSKQP
ncbi:hypothetical protein AC1031_004223 [Aphanomyces cochlioides]|nr:hypothetical protein AC1031_004223 [Aphanomyces cochlioides]